MKFLKCKICKDSTCRVAHIDMKKIPLCNWCFNCIAYEQIKYLAIEESSRIREELGLSKEDKEHEK